MAGRDEFGQIVVRAETGIQLPVIRRVVTVAAGLKKRSDIKRRAADGRDVVDPGKQRTQTVHRLAIVVLFRCACQSKRINMVENSFIIPCHHAALLVCLCPIIRVPLRERKAEPSPALGHSWFCAAERSWGRSIQRHASRRHLRFCVPSDTGSLPTPWRRIQRAAADDASSAGKI